MLKKKEKEKKAGKIRNKTLVLIFSVAVLISAVMIIYVRFTRPESTQAVVYVNGEEVCRFSLAGNFEPYTYKLEGNTMLIEPGKISVCEADCPDKLCVRQGKISTPNIPIVCLPNRLSIVIVTDDSPIDGVTR